MSKEITKGRVLYCDTIHTRIAMTHSNENNAINIKDIDKNRKDANNNTKKLQQIDTKRVGYVSYEDFDACRKERISWLREKKFKPES
jgi:hypothetical protein